MVGHQSQKKLFVVNMIYVTVNKLQVLNWHVDNDVNFDIMSLSDLAAPKQNM